MRIIKQIIRLILFLLITLVTSILQILNAIFYRRDKYVAARLWHRLCLRAIGVRVRVMGAAADGCTLFISNHVSHLDIAVLGGIINGRFISKQEVKNWPLFGFLARLGDTIFIDRRPNPKSIASARATIQKALDEPTRLIVFPEGTNSIGNTLLPFKRAALEGLNAAGYTIQPLAIRVERVNGKPLETPEDFEVYGWGDIDFATHFWRVLGQNSIDVCVHILSPLDNAPNPDITRDHIDATRTAIAQALNLSDK